MSSIGVIGLGYVGLPLALALAAKYKVFGYDINPERLKNLRLGIDDTKAVSSNEIKNVEIEFVETPNLLKNCDIYIITVPTPLKKNHLPDFSFLEQATMTVSNILNRGDIVIYESTVYPGATEEICIPILEKSLLVFNRDFYVGYSPENKYRRLKKHI